LETKSLTISAKLSKKISFVILFFCVFGLRLFGALPEPTEAEKEFDRQLFKRRLVVAFSSRINPLSSSQQAEKERFFSALAHKKEYNPIFAYKEIPQKLRDFYSEDLRAPEKGFYGEILKNSLCGLKNSAAMLLTTDTEEFTRLSLSLYPAPESDLILEAQRIIRSVKIPDDEKNLTAVELKALLEEGLVEYGLKDWEVVLAEDMSARASVLPASMQVKINASSRFSQRDAIRLKLHEIGVHAVRAHNGQKKPLTIFATGLPGYLATEEGLAAYNEYQNDIDDGLPLFALRVLGVHWALRHSFVTTFKLVRQACGDDEVAWQITLRCKRGLRDTSLPGAYTKDLSYLRGFLMIKKAVKKDPAIFNILLNSGKTSLSYLASLNIN
jgi:hypothetical protein